MNTDGWVTDRQLKEAAENYFKAEGSGSWSTWHSWARIRNPNRKWWQWSRPKYLHKRTDQFTDEEWEAYRKEVIHL